MGYNQFDITPTDSFARHRSIRTFTEGILYSVSLVGHTTAYPLIYNWAEIGIIGPADDNSQILAILTNGQFGPVGGLGWTGRHPVTTDDRLYVDIYGLSTDQFKLSYLILQPDPNKTSMEVLDA